MKQKFIGVSKEMLGKIIILADEGEKLSMALENNNQDMRVLLHALVSESRIGARLNDPRKKLLE